MVVLRGGKAAAADSNPALPDVFKAHIAQVEIAPRAGQYVGVRLFIQGVGCHRGCGEFAVFAEWLQYEAIVFQYAQRAVSSRSRTGGDGRTFENFSQVQGQAGIVAPEHGQGGEYGRVIGPAGNHHVTPGAQGPLYGFYSHLGHQGPGFMQGVCGERRGARKRCYPLLLQAIKHDLCCDVRRDYAQAKRELQLSSQFLYDIDCPLQVRLGPCAAGTADDQWNAAAYCSRQ